MGHGAPNKKGLDYFPKMIDFYEDDKIFDLLDRYGPLGVTVYDCILCIVYKNGYYAEIPLDKLSRMITRMIGNKWVKTSKAVAQVVHFCSEIGLIDDALMTKNIITSVGIQKRFYRIAVKLMKRQLYDDRYWLLDEDGNEKPFLNVSQNRITSEENRITSEENRITSELSPVKEKENKIKDICGSQPSEYFTDKELDEIFHAFLDMRQQKDGCLSDEQILLLKEELESMTPVTAERVAIVRKSIVSGWKSFYPVKKPQAKEPKKNGFSNFRQREYDFNEYEKQLLGAGSGAGTKERK